MQRQRENRITVLVLSVLFICGIAAHSLKGVFTISLASQFMMAVCIVWILVVSKRIVYKRLRLLMMGMGICLLSLFVLQIIKYNFVYSNDALNRYVLYAYQIPTAIIPLLTFYSALCIGKREEEKINGIWLCVPCVLLVIGYLTNDMHGLAYRNIVRDGVYDGYGIISYAARIWQIILFLSAFAAAVQRCRVIKTNKYLPVIFLLLGALLYAVYILNGSNQIKIGFTHIQFQDIFAFTVIGFCESCIYAGLIPSNGDYAQVFERLSANAVFVNGSNLIKTAKVSDIRAEDMKAALNGSVMLDKNTRLMSKMLKNGILYYTEDLTEINRLNEDIMDTSQQLSEEGELLRREAEIKRKKTAYETQNMTYDKISADVEAKLWLIEEKIKHMTRDDLADVCVIGAYIKRRANLYLLSQQGGIDVNELSLAVFESLENLKLTGVRCMTAAKGSGNISGEQALAAYDFFEDLIEQSSKAQSFMVNIELKEKLQIIVGIGFKDIAPPIKSSAGTTEIDGTDIISVFTV